MLDRLEPIRLVEAAQRSGARSQTARARQASSCLPASRRGALPGDAAGVAGRAFEVDDVPSVGVHESEARDPADRELEWDEDDSSRTGSARAWNSASKRNPRGEREEAGGVYAALYERQFLTDPTSTTLTPA
jgi:hypothetical protein